MKVYVVEHGKTSRQAIVDTEQAKSEHDKQTNQQSDFADSVSRKAVLDLLKHDVWNDVIEAIEALPSTDRNGEWKEDETGNGFWICSSCGFVSEASGAWLLYKYCPHCGADMRGADDESTI